ncbi:MAG: spermidine synthase [Candidatus Omnitrophota bacterium]
MADKEKTAKFVELFLISLLALYFEILFIRWIPSNIQILAYFANIILISAFLGLGIGCLLTSLEFDLMSFFPFLIFNMVALLMGLNKVEIMTAGIRGEHLLGFYGPKGANFLIILAIVFIFTTLIFIPLGQKLGNCLKYFKPLVAYSINIGGSIAGVAVFTLFSTLMLAPLQWFSFGLLVALWFFFSSRRNLFLQSLIVMFALFVVAEMNTDSNWSPYYKIAVFPLTSTQTRKPYAFFISANDTHHQYAYDLSEKSVNELPRLKKYRDVYEFPYNFIRPKNVLILGAGSGNDAASALRRGVKEITAVEIDPFIASLGKNLHEEKPYWSKNVHLVIDDARSFVKKADKEFDLITFGYLDAHKVLSQFSSVRLDNFIYTKESFQDIKEHLSRDGMLSLTYLVFREWIGDKLYAALREVFGDDLKVFRTTGNTVIFLAGPAVKNIKAINMADISLYGGFKNNARFTTDDWPYLYLTKKGIPPHYLLILVLVLAIAYVSIIGTGLAPFNKFNSHFFFLGSGFMLLETVGITRFALLFGSTWMVNSAVIISILIMILLANLYVTKIKQVNVRILYLLLLSSIFLNWLLNPEFYLVFNKTLAVIFSSFVLSLPILFASIIFANSFKDAKDVSTVFAYNLLGAILGGFCEYISMATGFRFLLLIIMFIYCLSYLSLKARKDNRLAWGMAPQP